MPFQPRRLNPAPSVKSFLKSKVWSTSSSLFVIAATVLIWTVVASGVAMAQASIEVSKASNSAQNGSPADPPFEVSNPKHRKFPEVDALRIYTQACDLLARSVRPEHPPQLRPRFRLVLGTDSDEFVRDAAETEIHLKSWNPEKFAQGVVIVALREVVPRPDLARLARLSVSMATSAVDVSDLGNH
jgi:hypothetical protein